MRSQGHSSSIVNVKNYNRKYKINEKFIEKIALDVLRILKKKKSFLEIVFLTDKAIRPVNKKYRNSDRTTDVLSFDLRVCGEILISSDTALRNSGIFNTKFEHELVLYVIHGVLHLFGYEDETPEAKKRMSKKENAILEKLCGKENLSKVLTRR